MVYTILNDHAGKAMSLTRGPNGLVRFVALTAFGLVGPSAVALDAEGVRRIRIPHYEHGYYKLKSQVIQTQEQFDQFVKAVDKQKGWNRRADFLQALKKANIDFTAEALVLIQHSESSGSHGVIFAPTELRGRTLVCTIRRKAAAVVTHDMAYYCLALAIPKETIDHVEQRINNQRIQVIKLREQGPNGEGEKYAPLVLDLGGGVTMKFARIEAGAFLMGASDTEVFNPMAVPGAKSEKPRHEVRITRPFYLGIYPVTQAQYLRIMGENPSYFSASHSGIIGKGVDTANFPVDSVSWKSAKDFCRKLSALPAWNSPEWTADLPTEAEWEYACRAGTTTRYHSGDEFASLDKAAWYSANNKRRTHPVGQKAANPWGLYDLHGNVLQWCADWHSETYYKKSPLINPTGPDRAVSDNEGRVARGGCWQYPADWCRAASRHWPADDDYTVGFRVAVLMSPRTPVDDLLEEYWRLRQRIEMLEKRLADLEKKK